MTRGGIPPRKRIIGTVVSAVVVFVVALAPGLIAAGSPLAALRLPIECVVVLALLLLLPWRGARVAVAVAAGALLVLATVGAALDRVFLAEVGRPFDVATGWQELTDGYGVVSDSTGSIATFVLLLLVSVLAVGLVAAVSASFLRLASALRPRRRAALVGATAATAAWAVLSITAVQVLSGVPVAADDAVQQVVAKADQVAVAARDKAVFDRAASTDPYAHLPASDLLTGLRGKDVVVAFVESYGRSAVQDSSFSAGVDAVLRRGEHQLTAHGYAERSAFLTSPTFGGISWLAHSTLQSGLWIDSQQKYDEVTAGRRLTLAGAFRKAGWRTVSDVPSDTKPWAVGSSFYGYGTELNATNVGYRGPAFSYARVPDQYTWAYFQQHELSRPHSPLMAEIDLVSSHTPWTPLPRLLPWRSIGDGSAYDPQPAEGQPPSVVWQDPRHVQQLYGQSIQYSLGSLFSFLTNTDDPNLVVVVLGDHQPASVVSGAAADHDVPISIIAKDPAVIQRIGGWAWQPGMLPSPTAPVWRMDAFRDRFLQAYGP